MGPECAELRGRRQLPGSELAGREEILSVRAAVGEALELYVTHSQKQGLSYPSKDDALDRLSEIQERFWKGTEEFAKSEWPLRWHSKMHELEELKLPNSERERILNLKNRKQRGG